MLGTNKDAKETLSFFIGIVFFCFFMYISFYLIGITGAILTDYPNDINQRIHWFFFGDIEGRILLAIIGLDELYYIPLPFSVYLSIKLSVYFVKNNTNKLIKE